MVDTNDMALFSAVVSTGSLTAAGKLVGVSPAVVSKRIRRLEDQLGTRLLQRTTRQISLTDAGKGYHNRIVDILAGIEEAEGYLTNRSNHATGTLKVSAPTGFGRMHIDIHIFRRERDHQNCYRVLPRRQQVTVRLHHRVGERLVHHRPPIHKQHDLAAI